MNVSNKLLARVLFSVMLTLPLQVWAQAEIELEGAVTGVSGTNIELFEGLVRVETLGAGIETDGKDIANISDLKPGTSVEIDAEARADGVIQAKSVEVSDEKENDAEIVGVIRTVDQAALMFTIGPIEIVWNGETKFHKLSGPVGGRLAEVNLQVSGDRLLATKVEEEEDDD